MNKILTLFAVAASMMLSAQANAQLAGLKQTASAYGAAVTDAVMPGDTSQEAIVQSYVRANIAVLLAHAKLADAFGHKEEAATAQATADALQSGSTEMDKKTLKANLDVTEAALTQSQGWADSSVELSVEGRKSYVEGLAMATQSVLSTKALATDVSTFATTAQSEIKSSSMMQKPKLIRKFAAGMFVAKELPGFTSRLTQNLGSLLAFAKSADIPTPDDATDAMADL